MGTVIAKWGHSLAVRLPKDIITKVGLSQGDRVSIEVDDEGVIKLKPTRPKYSLDQLVGGITETNLHRETDWGDSRGDEVW